MCVQEHQLLTCVLLGQPHTQRLQPVTFKVGTDRRLILRLRQDFPCAASHDGAAWPCSAGASPDRFEQPVTPWGQPFSSLAYR